MSEDLYKDFFKDRFVVHHQAQKILDEMHHIFRMSKFNTRPKNLLIIADAGAGKTALSNAFTQSIVEEGAGNSQKLVLFQMPPVPSEKAIMFALLDNCLLYTSPSPRD